MLRRQVNPAMNGSRASASGRSVLRRTASMAALAALGMVALSGCFKLEMALELSENDTVDGSIIIAVDRDQADLFGGEDALREALAGEAGGALADQPTTGTVDTKDYEDDEWIGTEYIFSDVALDEFTGAETGELSITRDGDEFIVDGSLDLSQGADADPSAAALLDSAEVTISITFPGGVESSNGVEDGNTVTWTPRAGEVTEINAVGSAVAGIPWTPILAGLALLALVVIGVVLLLVLRKQQSSDEPAPGPLPDGSIVPGELSAPAPPVPPAPPPS